MVPLIQRLAWSLFYELPAGLVFVKFSFYVSACMNVGQHQSEYKFWHVRTHHSTRIIQIKKVVSLLCSKSIIISLHVFQ
jgi:hypothetical protein